LLASIIPEIPVLQVIMITGDKQETAINIATSCKLIGSLEGLLLCNSPFSRETARAKMEELLTKMGKSGDPQAGFKVGTCVDGRGGGVKFM
jgi:magnesium-transporting ATPase (P-type)